MKTIVSWSLILLCGWAGSWLGGFFGLMPSLFLGLVGSGLGMFLASWIARNYG